MKVAILAGGRSSEHDVSLSSARAVEAALLETGYGVERVILERHGSWTYRDAPLELIPGGGLIGADVVFPVLHGPFGEDGTVQGLLELLDVPYVGAGVLASSLCMNKALFKDVLTAAGLPLVEYRTLSRCCLDGDFSSVVCEVEPLGLPLFVKPARLGSSYGISKVSELDQLQDALLAAFEHDSLAIVERASWGVEVECSVIGLYEPEASQPGEINLKTTEWYDYDAKYTPGAMEMIIPARLPANVIERVRGLACDTFTRVGCTGLARVDFFIEDERVLISEVNTIPGFTPTSGFPKMLAVSGINFVEVCERLIGYAVEHYQRDRIDGRRVGGSGQQTGVRVKPISSGSSVGV